MRDPLLEWVIENLKKPGKSQSGLARHLGLDPSAINRVVAGKRELKTKEIPGAAEYFEATPPEFEISLAPNTSLVPARLAGVVEAGSFREVEDFDQSEPETVFVPQDAQFPSARVLLFDVAGDSMNDLKPFPILPGAQAVCLAFEDIADQVKVRDGMVVVVERTRDGGHTREWSIKQVEYYPDRVEFHPRSTNPRHKPIVLPHDYQADDGTIVQIIALLRSTNNVYPTY